MTKCNKEPFNAIKLCNTFKEKVVSKLWSNWRFSPSLLPGDVSEISEEVPCMKRLTCLRCLDQRKVAIRVTLLWWLFILLDLAGANFLKEAFILLGCGLQKLDNRYWLWCNPCFLFSALTRSPPSSHSFLPCDLLKNVPLHCRTWHGHSWRGSRYGVKRPKGESEGGVEKMGEGRSEGPRDLPQGISVLYLEPFHEWLRHVLHWSRTFFRLTL